MVDFRGMRPFGTSTSGPGVWASALVIAADGRGTSTLGSDNGEANVAPKSNLKIANAPNASAICQPR